MAGRVFAVTGANKGIGFYAVKQLCSQVSQNDVVYLTARNSDLGHKAVKELENENLKPTFYQLDINDRKSIAFRDFVLEKHGGLDVLVNNAAIAYSAESKAPFSEHAAVTIACNYFGTLAVCDILFPILRPHARVVNVSSALNRISWQKLSPDLQSKFADPNLTVAGLDYLMKEFVDTSRTDTHIPTEFPSLDYGMSKIAVTFLTKIQQKNFDQNPQNTIVVNSCCPGYCDTDMTSHKGPRPAADGARVVVFLALLEKDWSGEKGQFWEDNAVTPFPPA